MAIDMRALVAGLAGGANTLGTNINRRKDRREVEAEQEKMAQRAEDRAMRMLLAKPSKENTQVVTGADENGPGIFLVDKDTGTKKRITDQAMAQLTGAPAAAPPRQPLLRKPGDAMPDMSGAPIAPPLPGPEPEDHGSTDVPPAPRLGGGLRPLPSKPTAPPSDALARKSPITIKVDGKVTQALVDGHGKFFDATGLPIAGNIEHYEAPREPGVIPVQRGDGEGGVETVLAPKVVGQVVPGPNTRTPAAIQKDVASNRTQIAVIDQALAELDAHHDAVGVKRGLSVLPGMGKVGEIVNQHADSAGVKARNALQNVSSLQIKSRSGSAVTPSEMERLGFIPSQEYTYAANRQKLLDLKKYVETETKLLEQGGGGPPAKPKSDDAEFDAMMATAKPKPKPPA